MSFFLTKVVAAAATADKGDDKNDYDNVVVDAVMIIKRIMITMMMRTPLLFNFSVLLMAMRKTNYIMEMIFF